MKNIYKYISLLLALFFLLTSCKKKEEKPVSSSVTETESSVVPKSMEPVEESSEPVSSHISEVSSVVPESSELVEVSYVVTEEDIYGKAPSEEHIAAANAFQQVLRDHASSIELYRWQFMDEEFYSIGSRPILIENILGNDIPELIFAEGISEFESVLRIFTYKDGQAVSVLDMSFDVAAGGGTEYHIYHKSGRNNLFMEITNGDETVTKRNIEIVYTNGSLSLNTLSKIEDTENGEVYVYNSSMISKENYDELYQIFRCDSDNDIIMFNSMYEFMNDKDLRINSYSFNGAINVLKSTEYTVEGLGGKVLTLSELYEIRSADHSITLTDEMLDGKLKIDSPRGREVCLYHAPIVGAGQINENIYFITLGTVETDFEVGLIAQYEGETTYFIDSPFVSGESIYLYLPGTRINEVGTALYNYRIGDMELNLFSDPIDYAVIECKEDSFIFDIK